MQLDPAIAFDEALPVNARRHEIAAAIAAHPVVVICGETGSGKTTQLPKILLAMGRGARARIGHTQPRRLAASSVARRIAQELDSAPGELIGYQVRFVERIQPRARVKLMTDGILLAETGSDPLLRGYDTIIIDEAHERSLNIDFLLGYLRGILPRRPDLKLIVTSATLDAERMAAHFAGPDGPAPVIQVSGRLYPVEIRYRPFDEEAMAAVAGVAGEAGLPQPAQSPNKSASREPRESPDLPQAVVDAVDELCALGSGDVLVFLPGEREIREVAEALRKHHPPATEILALFARLSAEEQERVFHPGRARRIVLATNIAETSLTVPGIRYVVDAGLARVKRYSYRNKVEQLQIEPVSRAAADQRAGRCGRVAAGVCIRLYSELEFQGRPRFTDPEVLRSSLAAVILRMRALGLGDPAQFPFLDAPSPRAITDGLQLLAELNALDDDEGLTTTGRELARLPVDPRVGRMLLAAREQHCLSEALVIAAALSVQDPRERPPGQQQAADEAHRRLADPRSDFLSLVKLWDDLQQRFEHRKSQRRLAEELRREFIHVRRVREWRDVHSQLHQLVAEQGWRLNTSPATYEQLHRALLAGLLGNVGSRAADAEVGDRRDAPFAGARGIRFHLWPATAKAHRADRWVVAAELVETSRLYARTVAQIDPRWLEKAGEHLLRRSYGEPHWEKRAGQAMVYERGTLYGLTVYQQRRVPYAPIDAPHAREILLREGLVEGQWESRAAFLAHNRQMVAQIRELEHRTRRPDILVDDEQIVAFYEEKIPAGICTGAQLEAWWTETARTAPRCLHLTREALMRHDGGGSATELFPKVLDLGGGALALAYHFEPGSARDGVTATVPLAALNQADARRAEWLVPGMVKEKAAQLLKSLPQRLRRACVPLPEYSAGFAQRHASLPAGTRGAFIDALIADVRAQTGVVAAAGDFRPESLPTHLSLNFKVVDEHGRQLAMGRNLAALRAELAPQAEEHFRDLAQEEGAGDDAPITDWDFGELPERRELRGGGLTAYPALVDKGEHCVLEMLDDPGAARAATARGLVRLLRLQLRSQVAGIERNLTALGTLQMRARAGKLLRHLDSLAPQVIEAALERAGLAEPWPRERAAFQARKEEVRGRLGLIAQEVARTTTQILEEAIAIDRRVAALGNVPARADVEQQLARLLGARFVVTTPPEHFGHLPRYLKAIGLRLDKLRSEAARDATRMAELASLQTRWLRAVAARRGQPDPGLEDFRWQLEELRVSLFAQELRTPHPVSVKRLEKVWASLPA